MADIKIFTKTKTVKLNKNGKARQPRKLAKKQVEDCSWKLANER